MNFRFEYVSEGFYIARMSAILLLCQSEALYMQQASRGLRSIPKTDKRD